MFASIVLLFALSVRVIAATLFGNDAPDDARVYVRIADNLLQHGVYSAETSAPYVPCFYRMPGYPLVLAGARWLFGDGAPYAVRMLQAFVDTCTCVLVAWLAFVWTPLRAPLALRRRVYRGALVLAALAPFVQVYVTTLLTEVLTTFAWAATILLASLAWLTPWRRGLWAGAGALAGLATLFRPDSGLLVVAVLVTLLACTWRELREPGAPFGSIAGASARRGLAFALAFACMLAPWTLRNALVFRAFLPIPASTPILGEVPLGSGYASWLRTWADDMRYTAALEWPIDSEPIRIEQVPPHAFDDAHEAARVEALFERYNHPSAALLATRPGAKVALTREIDDAFAALARERVARHPLRQHLLLPLRRAFTLWFDTHSDYFSFAGPLLPWSEVPRSDRLPRLAFALLVALLTLGAMFAMLVLTRERTHQPVAWLIGSIVLPRFALLSRMSNPEPRYVVELFPLIFALAALAWVPVFGRLRVYVRSSRRLPRGLAPRALFALVFSSMLGSSFGQASELTMAPAARVTPAPTAQTPSVVLVTLDGVRWQDIYGPDAHAPSLRWLASVDGAALGTPESGTTLSASNPAFVSLPGYIELLTGRNDSRCESNDCGVTPFPTIADEVSQAELGDVAVFSSWSGIDFAASAAAHAVPVSAGRHEGRGRDLLEHDPAIAGPLREAESAAGAMEPSEFRPDAATGELALRYLQSHRAAFVFVSLGETDEYAHAANRAGYLAALEQDDAIVGRIARHVFERNASGHPTTLIVTTDHGRARGFVSHGRDAPESARVWLVAAGAGIHARGAIASPCARHLADVAPTIRALLGLPGVPGRGAGEVLTELFGAASTHG